MANDDDPDGLEKEKIQPEKLQDDVQKIFATKIADYGRLAKLRKSRTIPEIFIPVEKQFSLTDVLLERYSYADIFWFCWPRDGIIVWEQDLEPVSILYNDEKIIAVITRRHWRYQTYAVDELKSPLQILFNGSSHPAFPNTNAYADWFHAKTCDLELRAYQAVEIEPDIIPRKFRTGNGHTTNLVPVTDPAEYSIEIHRYLTG